MISILSNNNADKIKDCGRLSQPDLECPVTYAESIVCPLSGLKTPHETVLTHSSDHFTNQCLDYIFVIKTKRHLKTKSKGMKKLKCDISQTKIEKFMVKGQTFTQLSDHYGVSTIILI